MQYADGWGENKRSHRTLKLVPTIKSRIKNSTINVSPIEQSHAVNSSTRFTVRRHGAIFIHEENRQAQVPSPKFGC